MFAKSQHQHSQNWAFWPATGQYNDAFVVLHFLGLVNVASEEELFIVVTDAAVTIAVAAVAPAPLV